MGEPNAEISTQESFAGLKSILQAAGKAQSGKEYPGTIIHW
jgi:hypothetical protein